MVSAIEREAVASVASASHSLHERVPAPKAKSA
jgi:hypothetical protein